MYCSNCGTRVEDDALFCGECGEKVERRGRHSFSVSKISFTRRQKRVLFLILIFFFGTFCFKVVDSYFFGEDVVIKRYTRAYVCGDYHTIIELSDISKNEFMKDSTILNKYGKKNDEKVKVDILSSNTHKDTHTRTVRYCRSNGSCNILNLTIKNKGRKYLVFNKYVIVSNNLVAHDIKVSVPSGVGLKVDNVLMTDKYLYKSTKKNNTYKIGEVLSKNVMLELVFADGMKISSTRNFFTDESVNVENFYNNSLDLEHRKKVVNRVLDATSLIINGAIEGKELSKLDTENIYTANILKSSSFLDNYDFLKGKLKAKKISNFKIGKIDVSNVYLNKNDISKLEVNCKMNYSYKSDNIKRLSSRNIKMVLDTSDNLRVDEFYFANLYTLF